MSVPETSAGHVLTVAELIEKPSTYLDHKVTVQGYFLSPILGFYNYKKLRRWHNEAVESYVARIERASPSVELNYLVCLSPNTEYLPDYDDRYITVDARLKEFIVNDRNLYLPERRRFWFLIVPLYRRLWREKSQFTQNAVRLDIPDLCATLQKHGIPLWVMTDYRYKFPATVTGTFCHDCSPEFQYRLHNVSHISIPEFTDRMHHDSVKIDFRR